MIPHGCAERIELAAGTTAVVFTWAGDRWEHELRLADGRGWRSVEGPGTGPGDPRWPASPPLIEISLTTTTGDPAILGLGRAGRSHYSLCVAACPNEPDTLLFDLACRIHEPPAWLGSRYQSTAGPGDWSLAADPAPSLPATIRWAYTVGPEGIRPRLAAGGSASRERPG